MPIEIAPEFMTDDLVMELSQRLKELQADFKEIHKQADQLRQSGSRPAELKAEIATLEQESGQLKNKLAKMKRDMNVDESYFKEMLKATSALRKEQESEVLHMERLREHKKASQDADLRFADASRRLTDLKSSGVQSQSAEQILNKLHQDVKDLNEKREIIDKTIGEREAHLEKLQSWDNADRHTTDDDVRVKREQVQDLEQEVSSLQDQLDAALERNSKLVVFKQASSMAMKKYREKEDEVISFFVIRFGNLINNVFLLAGETKRRAATLQQIN
jgi:intraflagellar transport protein 81